MQLGHSYHTERKVWYRLAYRQHCSLQKCLNSNTSSEFIQWITELEEIEWTERTKQDHYMAQLAAEVRVFREGFGKTPKGVAVEDLFIKFTKEAQVSKLEETETKEPVEPSPELVASDPKWAAVTAMAKTVWAARLGIDPSEIKPPV